MPAVERCRHTLGFLAAVKDTSVTHRVCQALDDLEAAYPNQVCRADALTRLLQQMQGSNPTQPVTPFRRFLIALIERRQAA